jgi:hypothetical protein
MSDVIAKYFLAWKRQDIDLLFDIFCGDAYYKVIPGERIFQGHSGIKTYWEDNVYRQCNINILWSRIGSIDNCITTMFYATFEDVFDHHRTQILGYIRFFLLSSGNTTKIEGIEEEYIKGTNLPVITDIPTIEVV